MALFSIPARPAPLPRPIRRVLGRIDRRLRAAASLRGLGAVAVIVASGAVLGMAADFAWSLPQLARWAIWGAWLAAGALGMALGVIRPLVRRVRPLDLAAVAERGHPGLDGRLTGAVDLLVRPDPRNGSPALVEALADEASAHASAIELSRAVPLRAAGRRLALGVAALSLVAAPGIVRPDPFGTLARRFLAPWADLDRVGVFVVAVEPGDRVLAVGDDLTVSARVRPRFGRLPAPEDAWLEWSEGRGDPHRMAMAAESTGPSPSTSRGFSATLPRLTGSLSYRVVSGPAASRSFRVKALEPPAVLAIRARVEPPAYTKLPPEVVRNPARIEAREGSRVLLDLSTSRAVRAVEVQWPDGRGPIPAALARDGKSASTTRVAESSGTYAPSLRDEFGLVNRAESPRRVVVRPDAPPVLAVRGAEALKESGPDDVLQLDVAARDDIAVASAELHYAIRRNRSGGAESGRVAVPLDGLGTPVARGMADLPLKPLNLEPGDALSYRVRVADNRPAPRGPNVVWSSERELAIVAQAEPMLARRDRAGRERLEARLEALKKATDENRKETEQLRYAADAVQRGNGSWDKERRQALDRREAEARDVVDRLQVLSRELADDPQFRALARPARQIAEVEAESGRALLDQARHQADPALRLGDLRQADARLAAVSNRLEELRRQLDAPARREEDRRRLRDLAGREEAIAARAADADRKGLDRLQADQEAVRNDLDALLKASPSLRAEALAEQAGTAEALARRARDLAGRQREEARQATDLARHADALKALAEEQHALEDDARRLALEVDEPLAENGRRRLEVAPIRQAAEPLGRGDLDEARERLEAAEAELRRLARDLEEVPDDPKALAGRLVRRQAALNAESAEAIREARGEDGPDAAELAARLRPLAGRQEALARLAAGIQAPRDDQEGGPLKTFPRAAAESAARSTTRLAEALREADPKPREIEARRDEARRDLQRLADALPSPQRRQESARRQLAEVRRPANDVARALETLPRAPSPEDLAGRVDPLAGPQGRIAEALAALEVPPHVAPQLARASRRARALADALAAAAAKETSPDRRRELGAALPALEAEARASLDRLDQALRGPVPADDVADELAADQRDLRALARAAKPGARPAEDQRRIATALRNLVVPDASKAQAEAVRAAEQAARALSDPDPAHDPSPALQAAEAASRTLADQLADPPGAVAAKPAGPPAPADPELGIDRDQAESARRLARRERRLRERLQAMLGERVEPQQALREESAALGRALADLRDRVRPLDDRAQGPAQEAARLLGEHAPRAMDQGAEHLAMGQPSPARESQRRAAGLVERGAQQAEDLAAALRAAAPPGPPGVSSPLAEAREAMRLAADQLDRARDAAPSGPAAEAARRSMSEAARDLRAAAAQAAGSQGEGEAPGGGPSLAEQAGQGQGRDPEGTRAGQGASDLEALKALVRSKAGRSWGELPGHLRTEILQMSQGRYRDDYARLIQLYFREIAAGSEAPR